VQEVALLWAGPTAIGAALWALWLVQKGWLPPLPVLGVAVAVVVYVVGRVLLLKDVFILLSPYELSLWCRFHVRRRLVRKWAYRWEEVTSLRERERGPGAPPELRQPECWAGLTRGTLALQAAQFERERDWKRFKEVVIARAGLTHREEVLKRTYWGDKEYVLYSRDAASPHA